MKFCDFINSVLSRATEFPNMIRVINYKIGETYDFYDDVEKYGFHYSEIDNYYFATRVPNYYKLNICCTWQDSEHCLNIVVEE